MPSFWTKSSFAGSRRATTLPEARWRTTSSGPFRYCRVAVCDHEFPRKNPGRPADLLRSKWDRHFHYTRFGNLFESLERHSEIEHHALHFTHQGL